jgi:sarcosine oxidase
MAGLAAAHALRRRGVDVVVYEQFERGHRRGSSHGRSRIFRIGYAEPEWVRLAEEALTGWRRLEEESGGQLLELHGLLEVVRSLEESSAPTLEACGVRWERLDGDEVERRFPVHVPRGSFAVFQPDAGIVFAERARDALARGLDVRERTRVERLSDLDADAVVCAAGPWARGLLARDGIELDVRVTRETVAYFRLTNPRPTPVVASFKPETHEHDLYALADPGHGLNFQLCGPVVEGAETCLYTTTPDKRFVLERHGRIVIGSACSGHGFKFAPAIGTRLAALALEVAA